MSEHMLDGIARIMASPVPRRDAVKLIAGGFAGAVAAFFGARATFAAVECKGKIPCPTTNPKTCCSTGQVCIGKTATCCPSTQVCGPNNDICCPPGQNCVIVQGKKSCKSTKPSSS